VPEVLALEKQRSDGVQRDTAARHAAKLITVVTRW
jgi:hypothetical protein